MTEGDGLAFIVGLVGLMISLCALGFTFYHSWAIRMHNRLAVAPGIKLDYEYNDSDGVFEVVLKNSGLGPAKLTSIKYSLKGAGKNPEEFRQYILDMTSSTEDQYRMCVGVAEEGDFLAKDEDLTIFRVEFDDKSQATPAAQKYMCDGWNVEVAFESVYGEKGQRTLF